VKWLHKVLAHEQDPAYFNMMTEFKGKRGLKLLLIITMVVQPVAFSYVMAGMDHSYHQISGSLEQSHHGHHAMNGDVSPVQQQDHDSGAGTLNDCCNNAMCCAAITVDAEVALLVPSSAYSLSPSSSWEGIDLPTEFRPPRSFLG
jgi:hypothetical protein